jgi:hypothetical protein
MTTAGKTTAGMTAAGRRRGGAGLPARVGRR